MAESVRRRSWGGVLPLGRQASISSSSLIQCASVSIALSSFQEEQNARHHKQFKLEQALEPGRSSSYSRPWFVTVGVVLLITCFMPMHAYFGFNAPCNRGFIFASK